MDFRTLGQRIKSERQRLGLTQPAFAELAAGAKKNTLVDWERGATSPTAKQLVALLSAGVDVPYVLTGVQTDARALKNLALAAHVTHSVDGVSDDERAAVEQQLLGGAAGVAEGRGRYGAALRNDQAALLAAYDLCPDDAKRAALDLLAAVAQAISGAAAKRGGDDNE
jgi:transcriptional regulator with XRE-family HTH domain